MPKWGRAVLQQMFKYTIHCYQLLLPLTWVQEFKNCPFKSLVSVLKEMEENSSNFTGLNQGCILIALKSKGNFIE